MLTIDKLAALGADTKDGLNRCINNETLYLRLVLKALESDKLPALEEALNNRDLDTAFECAHALKGIYLNLSLTPLAEIAVAINEDLRIRKEKDYGPELAELKKRKAAFDEAAA